VLWSFRWLLWSSIYYGKIWSDEAEQYEEYATSGAFTTPTVYTDPQYAARTTAAETDWQDEIYQNGPMQDYNLSLSGGTENSYFRLSAGYIWINKYRYQYRLEKIQLQSQ